MARHGGTIASALAAALVGCALWAAPASAVVTNGKVLVSLAPTRITADGTETTAVTVTVLDQNGTPTAGENVQLQRSDDPTAVIGTTDQNDGTYTATLTGSAQTQTTDVTITGTDIVGINTPPGQATLTEDATAPSITLTAPTTGARYRLGQSVLASYSCPDPDDASVTCTGDVPSGATFDTSTPGDHTFTVTASDPAGNAATPQTVHYTVDDTPPVISISTPADGATVKQGASIPAAWSCSDPDAGDTVASCAPASGNGTLDTSTPGDHAFTVNATDAAGNTATKTVRYTVVAAPQPPMTSARSTSGPDRLKIARSVAAVAKGLVSLPVTCDAAADTWCHGDLFLTLFRFREGQLASTVTLGWTKFAVVAGRRINAVLALTPAGRRLLAQARSGRLAVLATITDDLADPKTSSSVVTLVAPADRVVSKRAAARRRRGRSH